ncbi:MAG: hypothetical protein WB562_05175 [Candidatus Sulfotelmatobacter sp.]
MKSDSRIVSMVKEAHRVAHVALNKVHGSRLVENHEVAATANALIAGRHVASGSTGGREIDHAGADAKGDGLLDDAFGTDEQKSSGNY